MPIAEHFKLIIDIQKENGGIYKDVKSEIFACWNINKKLNPYIRKRLKTEMQISKEFVFPDLNYLKDELAIGLTHVDQLEELGNKIGKKLYYFGDNRH